MYEDICMFMYVCTFVHYNKILKISLTLLSPPRPLAAPPHHDNPSRSCSVAVAILSYDPVAVVSYVDSGLVVAAILSNGGNDPVAVAVLSYTNGGPVAVVISFTENPSSGPVSPVTVAAVSFGDDDPVATVVAVVIVVAVAVVFLEVCSDGAAINFEEDDVLFDVDSGDVATVVVRKFSSLLSETQKMIMLIT